MWRFAAIVILIGLVGLGSSACGASASSATDWANALDPAEAPDCALYGHAPTFTEKPFWIVMGLVVLGWLVLAADFSTESDL
jgi:hypothetical protein